MPAAYTRPFHRPKQIRTELFVKHPSNLFCALLAQFSDFIVVYFVVVVFVLFFFCLFVRLIVSFFVFFFLFFIIVQIVAINPV